MSDRLPPEDPFSEDDPRAAERERRRREREARRRERAERSAGSRRSLADRVSGILGPAAGGAGGDPPERPLEPEPAEPPLEPESPGPHEPEPEPLEPGSPSGPVEPEAPERPVEPESREPLLADEQGGGPMPPAGQGSSGWGPRRPSAAGDATIRRRRRLAAGGAVFGVGAAIVLMLSALRGGEEPAPVAEPEPIETISVTVPEGLTIDQIADVAEENNLRGNYVKAVERAREDFPMARYDAADAPSMEGFLFPATYELERRARVTDLVDKQLEAFRQNFDGVNLKPARNKNLTPYEVLTIASMVEKEVQVAEERPMVAAVIYNRLSAGEPLGIDATLRYELENYDEQLLESELAADTPFNTRINAGLPPSPIANPGLASIEAAAQPADSDAYYFVIKPGTCGEHVFTDDEAEFLEAQARYQEALQAEGGSPTEC